MPALLEQYPSLIEEEVLCGKCQSHLLGQLGAFVLQTLCRREDRGSGSIEAVLRYG
jgi:hypothetical protein